AKDQAPAEARRARGQAPGPPAPGEGAPRGRPARRPGQSRPPEEPRRAGPGQDPLSRTVVAFDQKVGRSPANASESRGVAAGSLRRAGRWEAADRSGGGIVVGSLTAALGVVILLFPFASATGATLLLGSLLIVAGEVEFVLALASRTPGSFSLQAVLAALHGFTGLVLVAYPFEGAESLTAFLGGMLVVRGILALVAALRMRPLDGWTWFLADAIGSLVAGGLILARWPSSRSWAVGSLVGASVVVTGCAHIARAARIRRGSGHAREALPRLA